jgi:hypothetical protein
LLPHAAGEGPGRRMPYRRRCADSAAGRPACIYAMDTRRKGPAGRKVNGAAVQLYNGGTGSTHRADHRSRSRLNPEHCQLHLLDRAKQAINRSWAAGTTCTAATAAA